jgi:2-iminobutanoate/2-iminopropanoate deaminase
MKKVISTQNAPQAIGPYSQAIMAGPFLFCSGQIALSPDANLPIPGDINGQIEQVMTNIKGVLTQAGYGFGDVVKTTIFLTDMADFAAVNAIYGKYFPENPPARSTVAVAGLPRGVKVEVEVLAFKS